MINKQIYLLDFPKLVALLLPHFLRKAKQLGWILAFLKPFKTFYTAKQLFRFSIRYKMQHNGNVIYLEKVLNEYFNIVGYDHQNHQASKQIYIGEGENLFPLYLYTEAEQLPKYIKTAAENDPLFIYNQMEIDANHADFIVYVPAALVFIEAEMIALINYYINTKTYKIKTY